MIKTISKYITCMILSVASLSTLTSCIGEDVGQPASIQQQGKTILHVHISPLDTQTSNSTSPLVVEKIRSLRFILIGNNLIEANQYVNINEGEGEDITDFKYDITFQTSLGTKKMYVIANELSVGNISFDNEASGLPTNLTTLLESFRPSSSAEDFEETINAVGFAPSYDIDEQNNIFLPYTCMYDDIEIVKQNDNSGYGEASMFLVPVATKFIFQFVNYRPDNVEINNITVSKKDTHNFLFAHVYEPDYTKSFEGTDYYWINWLAKVSEASHNTNGFYDNVNFNEKYGWISNYTLPGFSRQEDEQFIGPSNIKTVLAGELVPDSEDINPSSLTLGPFYVPESLNVFTSNNDETPDADIIEQRYYLSLGLHDVTSLPGRDPVFEDVLIDNLHALFRNTCVVIKITMREGDVEVYAEINPWNVKTANGWLVEGNAPSNNPFTN